MRAVAVLSSGVVVNGSPTRPVESSRSLHVRPKSEQLGKRHGVGITSYFILCSGARLRSNRGVGTWGGTRASGGVGAGADCLTRGFASASPHDGMLIPNPTATQRVPAPKRVISIATYAAGNG